jgi:hypothetical protein
VDTGVFWRALAVQTTAVVLVAGFLLLLPLGDDFFEDWGFITGPAAWFLCSAVTARFLELPLGVVLFAALAGGVAGGIVTLVSSHWPGVAAAVLVFAASCGGYAGAPEEPVDQQTA